MPVGSLGLRLTGGSPGAQLSSRSRVSEPCPPGLTHLSAPSTYWPLCCCPSGVTSAQVCSLEPLSWTFGGCWAWIGPRSLPCSAWEPTSPCSSPETPVAPPRPVAIAAIPPQGPLTPVTPHPAQDTPAGSIRGGRAQSWARVASGPGHVEGRARGPQWMATLQFSRPPRADPLSRPR